jgi:signal recognition particle subunit SRP54
MGEGLRKALSVLSRSTIIDAKTIKEFNKELQKVLIASDVEVELVLRFTKEIEKKALASKPPAGLPPREYITNIVYEGLVELMGSSHEPEIKPQRILLLGLYGSGKTTTAAKLAKFYQSRGLSAGLICCDVSRPAAYEQLETLAKQANVSFFGMKGEKDAARIARSGVDYLSGKQIIICDTSGRSALDQNLINELKSVNNAFNPDQKVLVLSADIGQVAGPQAREFDNAVKISGVVVSKMDGSGKGGGALSATAASGAKVLFIGEGEKLNDIEPYDPNKFIGGLLGIPNISALVERVQNAVKEANIKPEEVDIEKMDLETFYIQLKAINKMGPLKGIFGMMGAPDVPKEMIEEGEEKLKRYKYIISSMTSNERKDASLLHDQSRISRIAKGSGTTEKDVRDLISNFNKMKKSYKMMKNNRNLKRMFGG